MGKSKSKVKTEFFVSMKNIPTTTHQEQQVRIVKNDKGKYVPVFYDPPELKEARQKFMAYLSPYVPDEPLLGATRLTVWWCYWHNGKHKNGEYKITKPDLDNNNKLLQDCMTKLGYWEDDKLIASLLVEKYWADIPGIFIRIEEL
ncbi:RusA family crossover junction endodeoxyribonuclease [Listeria booriae]|uniref:RusA family crossover junction endodeoxyribonuclease n=1 Tax=Listeria booriae TaxID=1552123 RepID=UPI0016281EF0|nr:RusA family crossover junction endodeoxyribonuclease [Listeria booriae]MBC1983027.1 RusA family crossover junction endodeoxyribonuclease [Listeria booriae]